MDIQTANENSFKFTDSSKQVLIMRVSAAVVTVVQILVMVEKQVTSKHDVDHTQDPALCLVHQWVTRLADGCPAPLVLTYLPRIVAATQQPG